MKYNIYRKRNNIKYPTLVYVKRKTGNYYEYGWISVKSLNGGYYAKDYTKASFNIFEAKKVINKYKTKDKKYCTIEDFIYWIKQEKD